VNVFYKSWVLFNGGKFILVPGMHIIKDTSEFRFEYLDEALNPASPFLPSCAEM
jgi:hypothetical protein